MNNNQEIYITDYIQDLLIDKKNYISKGSINIKQLDNSIENKNNTLQIEGIIDHVLISQKDLMQGKYDDAQLELFTYDVTSKKILSINHGKFGAVKYDSNIFTVDIVTLKQNFNRNFSNLYTKNCRANLGDKKCKANLTAFQELLTINRIINPSTFAVTSTQPNEYYNYGTAKFTSGNNTGITREINQHNDNLISLIIATPKPIKIGDQVTLIAGCNKNFNTCITKFNNALNFQGEPHLPGTQKVLKIHDQ